VRGEAYAGFWCGNLKERGYLEDLGVYGRIIAVEGIWSVELVSQLVSA